MSEPNPAEFRCGPMSLMHLDCGDHETPACPVRGDFVMTEIREAVTCEDCIPPDWLVEVRRQENEARNSFRRWAQWFGVACGVVAFAAVLWATWDYQPQSLHAQIEALQMRVSELEER